MDEDWKEELGVPGYLKLFIKADYTPQNEKIHDGFREMARLECRNDYTLALGKLLEYYDQDAKLEVFWDELKRLEERIQKLEEASKKPVVYEEDNGAF